MRTSSEVVNYIENQSAAYIDTGVVLLNTDTIEMDFEWVSVGGFLSGINAAQGSDQFYIYNTFAQWGYRVFPGWVASTRYAVTIDQTKLTMNGTDFLFSPLHTIDMRTATTLLCAAWSTIAATQVDSRRALVKIYSFAIKDENGNYKFNGKPAKSGGVYGLMDEVTHTFFGSASSTDFAGG